MDYDYDTDNELLEWHINQGYTEVEYTLDYEHFQKLGPNASLNIFTYNSSIIDRCAHPELYDRAGRLIRLEHHDDSQLDMEFLEETSNSSLKM